MQICYNIVVKFANDAKKSFCLTDTTCDFLLTITCGWLLYLLKITVGILVGLLSLAVTLIAFAFIASFYAIAFELKCMTFVSCQKLFANWLNF